MSTGMIAAIIIVVVALLAIWIWWPEHVWCERCHRRPAELQIGAEYLCERCIAREIDAGGRS